MIYNLFFAFLKIGTFAFGGGYTVLALISDIIVNQNAWVTESAFIDIVALSQMTPGPIAVNSATLIGSSTAGFYGAVVSTVGVVLPAVIIVSTLNHIIVKNKESKIVKNLLSSLRPASIGLIFAAAFMLFSRNVTDIKPLVFVVVSAFVSYKYRLNPIAIIAASAVIGVFVF